MVRRFTRRVQQSGVLIRARRSKFFQKQPSKLIAREQAIRRTHNRENREQLRKMGKIGYDALRIPKRSKKLKQEE